MPRPEKVQAVTEIRERLSSAEAVFVAEYAGLSVTEQQRLRRGLKAVAGEFKVVKLTLARRAASELGHDGLIDMLVGPTGLAFASGDAAATAKVLRDFARDGGRLVIKGALLGSEVIAPERVSQLADLEPREVLLAKVASVLQSPMTTMAGLLTALPRAVATMVRQLAERAPEAPTKPAADAGSPTDEGVGMTHETAAAEGPAPDTAEAGPEAPTESGTDAGEPSDDAPAEPRTDAGEPSDDAPAEPAEEE